ncbi:SoxR-reducing system protein RseC [Acerihabitans sp. TG2]|uniref:SoxR-reducing system protein RseC n=1 Tax=Acerihabitans sp. TG2 TaxID=3096008 RepID=UPI002B221F49|nr:SoxR-reducing system protein RseC [Acerihabitans sp. TG2]MEA9392427.1 SoxR-reducing system protein RseC [Acerihabitans sp. TG2]
MIKEWATVISWQQGVAQLRCEQHSGCGSCHSQGTCGTSILNKMGPESTQQLNVISTQPLVPGQRVEVGITEASLIRSALLVYMLPLVGLIGCAALMQGWFNTDLAAAFGGLVGATGGFMLARFYAQKLGDKRQYQPVILQIALPPSALRLEQEKPQ